MNVNIQTGIETPQFDGMSCPVPLRDFNEIVMGHGGGGKLTAELIEHLFLPAFGNEKLNQLRDSTILDIGDQRLAFSTDSFVVRPLFFLGGNIGDLAINGTVNDLAMSGAKPLYLSAAFIIEEGLPMETLHAIVKSMSLAARTACVQIVTGDTKVVERGHGDGCFINTTGIGVVRPGLLIGPDQASLGDVVILSGTIGDHGMAIMSVREGLEFESTIVSDSAPLHGLVEKMLAVCSGIRTLRDPTRGGVATSLNEIAAASNVGIEIEETAIPINPCVQSACELLGLDPLFVANEGKLLAIVPSTSADSTLAAMHQHQFGTNARVIGRVVDKHRKMVIAKTPFGSTRVITMPIGEQLPRIC